MREGPVWRRHTGPSVMRKPGSAHRLPLQLRRDLLAAIADLRRLPKILEIGLQPLLPDLLDACRSQLLLLRLEGNAVRRLALVDAKHEDAVLLPDRNADRADRQ